jgi:uncharacterized membrane protein
MEKDRLTAFSDGVIAVIITIMVLDLHAPKTADLHGLAELAPVFLSYVLSFVYVAIYWNNHHHFFQLVPRVTGGILWANLHLLFWVSLIPFTTSWLGGHFDRSLPTAVYGFSLLMPALAWYIMQLAIITAQGEGSPLAKAIGRDIKGKFVPLLYLTGIGFSFVEPWLADLLYVSVALIWLVPDRRIETQMARE